MSAAPELDAVLAEFHQFNRLFNSVILGTVNASGDADTSYAPTLQQAGRFYVYVSELAAHTRNMLEHPRVSLLFIEPETPANLFRRRRSSIRAQARRIDRDTLEWVALLDAYEAELGKMMRTLRELKDFHLFELTPIEASFVRGFGQAYKIC
jgi:putative heme iron utilization protein